jgi:nucleotide-binding universal stress UspA family protein
MNLLVCTDGRAASAKALNFAAQLKTRLGAELGVITVRSGTPATETPPPLGTPFALDQRQLLPPGLQVLIDAMSQLTEAGLLQPQTTVTIRDTPSGYMFACRTPEGGWIPFFEGFGHFIEVLNAEIDRNKYNLVLVAPPRRGAITRLVAGDTTRKLVLDLHASVLIVRGGNADSRFLICADGSPSARRQFPMLRHLLPAIVQPVDLIWVNQPGVGDPALRDAEACLEHASSWLAACGKGGHLHRMAGENRAQLITETAGSASVLVMGASLRHDVYRRMVGSLPMQVLSRTPASVLVVKLPPEADEAYFKDPFTC